jgi:multiple sugar transport system substrate-binding protein
MHAALKAGNAPDVAQVEYQEIPGFLLDNGLEDLSSYGAGQYENQFTAWQWKQCEYNGKVYCIPQASGPMGLFYREDLFKAAGITTPPATWADYEADAIKIHQHNPNEYIGTFPPGNSAWFTALAWQAGAKWFGIDGDAWKVNIDTPQTETVAKYWDKLRTEGVIKTEPDFANSWYKDLQTGNIAAWVSAQWGDGILKGNAPKTAGKWRVAPLPQWNAGDNAQGDWGGSTFAVTSQTKHPKEATEVARELFGTSEAAWKIGIDQAYLFPLVTPILNGSYFQDKKYDFFGGQQVNKVFGPAANGIQKFDWSPFQDFAYNTDTTEVGKALQGQTSWSSVNDNVQQQVTSYASKQGFKVSQ